MCGFCEFTGGANKDLKIPISDNRYMYITRFVEYKRCDYPLSALPKIAEGLVVHVEGDEDKRYSHNFKIKYCPICGRQVSEFNYERMNENEIED